LSEKSFVFIFGENCVFVFLIVTIMSEVIIYPCEDSYWVAECPSLPGCISQGESKEIAIINIKEAIGMYIETLKEDNLPIPEETFNTILLSV